MNVIKKFTAILFVVLVLFTITKLQTVYAYQGVDEQSVIELT